MPQLRIARPTSHLDRLVAMYSKGLGLSLLGGFEAHDGFSGAMLGMPDVGWHLEFTQEAGQSPIRIPSTEDMLVFYVADAAAHTMRCSAMLDAGFQCVAAHNPYWDRAGQTFIDFDGYRVVIQRGTWPASAAVPFPA
jgi:hypothetical protein